MWNRTVEQTGCPCSHTCRRSQLIPGPLLLAWATFSCDSIENRLAVRDGLKHHDSREDQDLTHNTSATQTVVSWRIAP